MNKSYQKSFSQKLNSILCYLGQFFRYIRNKNKLKESPMQIQECMLVCVKYQSNWWTITYSIQESIV